MAALKEAFPDVPENCFTIHNEVKCNGGCAHSGDVVSARHEGRLVLGELLINVGIHLPGDQPIIFAFIAKWAPIVEPLSSLPEDAYFVNYVPSNAAVIKVDVSMDLDTVFSYRMADDGNSCMVILPYECRRRP